MFKFRNFGVILLFILLFSFRFFAIHASPESWNVMNIYGNETTKSNPFSEIHNPYPHFYYAVEIRCISENVSEGYRFLSNLILPNQRVSINSNISGTTYFPVTFNYNSPVSIFIRGHALLC